MSRTVTSDRFLPGARLGDYVIERELRSEETGLVYFARHVVLPRVATLKVMHGGHVWLREMAIQVVREACVLEGLEHPGIPRVYECGVLGDRRPWIALEPLEGSTVAQSLGDGHVMPVLDTINMLRDVAEILDYLHGLDVVHRNLTSNNIVRRASTAKFPFALRAFSEAHTPEIELPPGLVDPSDDVHALGTVAYRALTGEVAVPGRSTSGRRPGASNELAELIDQMLDDRREVRPTAKQVRERAAMISAMASLVPSTIDKPRWTPAYGLGGDVVTGPNGTERIERISEEQPAVSATSTSEFSITIRR